MNEDKAGGRGVIETGVTEPSVTAARSWTEEWELVGLEGRKALINGCRLWPNTQLADMTKCSVCFLPFPFFWYPTMVVLVF